MVVTPYMPVPDTNGEEWDRLEPSFALDALVELILHGQYNSIIDRERRTKDGMELRAAALGIFQVRTSIFARRDCPLNDATTELRTERRDIRGDRPSHGLATRHVILLRIHLPSSYLFQAPKRL